MSYENKAGKARHFLRGKGLRILTSWRFSQIAIDHIRALAKSEGVSMTACIEDLILRQKVKKKKK